MRCRVSCQLCPVDTLEDDIDPRLEHDVSDAEFVDGHSDVIRARGVNSRLDNQRGDRLHLLQLGLGFKLEARG